MTFDVRELSRPILVAPMAGGPSTPELAAAATNAGGLGFVAAGYLSAETLAERIIATRRLTSGPVGVNLFVPRPSAAVAAEVEAYAEALAGEAQRYGVSLGEPRFDDDQWAAKLAVVLDLRPQLVSFTFGLPSAAECADLQAAGIATAGTVTTVAEAHAAMFCGLDSLVVQGPAAGGHRGTFDPAITPADQPLDELLPAVLDAVDVPVVAAGGLATADDVAAVRKAGAAAAQLGTAFLLADEAGSSPVHRNALTDAQFTETVVTRAFSGRCARGLLNRFIAEHDGQAPLGYPEIHYLTSPLRGASVRAGDPNGTSVWAGTGYRQARAAPAAEIIAGLG